MTSQPCDRCGTAVSIGGGIGGFWSSNPKPTGGITLEFDDGEEVFLCFACLESLPPDATAADIHNFDEE